MVCKYRFVQTQGSKVEHEKNHFDAQRLHGLQCPSLWDPKFYIGYIILNFKIEFSRSRSVIVIGIMLL